MKGGARRGSLPGSLRVCSHPQARCVSEAFSTTTSTSGACEDRAGVADDLAATAQPSGAGRYGPDSRKLPRAQADLAGADSIAEGRQHSVERTGRRCSITTTCRMTSSGSGSTGGWSIPARAQRSRRLAGHGAGTKLDYICRKLRLKRRAPAGRGCGWGGLVMWAALRGELGITLSETRPDTQRTDARPVGALPRRLRDYRGWTSLALSTSW